MRSAGPLVGALELLTSCAATPKLWTRADGGPVMATQYETDATVCPGEMQKAALTQREAKIYLPGECWLHGPARLPAASRVPADGRRLLRPGGIDSRLPNVAQDQSNKSIAGSYATEISNIFG